MIKPLRSVELMTKRGGSGTLVGAEADMMTCKEREERWQRSGRTGRRWWIVDGDIGLNSCHSDLLQQDSRLMWLGEKRQAAVRCDIMGIHTHEDEGKLE